MKRAIEQENGVGGVQTSTSPLNWGILHSIKKIKKKNGKDLF